GFENPLDHGWDLVGEAEIVSGSAHTGSYSLKLDTRGRAILPVSEENVYGTVTIWVKDSMASTSASSPRDGPRFGLLNKDGDAVLIGVFRKSYLSKSKYNYIVTGKNNYYDQYDTAIPRIGEWQKWTIEATGSGTLNVYQNDTLNANISGKEYFSKGFTGVYLLGGDAADPERFQFDDVTVEITAQGQIDSHAFPQSRVTGSILSDPNFFPIAVWSQLSTDIDYYKEMGVNVYVGSEDIPLKDRLDALQAKGIYGIVPFVRGSDHVYELYTEQINELKSHPALLGWMFGDEPDNYPPASPANLKQLYDGMYAIDQGRPIYTNFGSSVGNPSKRQAKATDYYSYCETTDIISYDIYPISSYLEGEKYLYFIAQGIDHLKNWSGNQKPIWIWLEASSIGGTYRAPTAAETRAEAWMAIIHGADGIGWFPHVWNPVTGAWRAYRDIPADVEQEMKSIGQTLASLAPVLNSQELPDEVSTEMLVQGRVDISSRIYNSKLYFFAVNMNRKDASAKIKLPASRANAKFSVINESRTVQASSGYFTEQFAPYGVHLYEEVQGTACSGDSQCNKTAGEKCCNNTCTTIVCSATKPCPTGQQCINGGECNAQCQNINCPQGAINTACYCAGLPKTTGYCCNNIHQTTHCTALCGTTTCTAEQICCNGTCIEPECSADANCSSGQHCTSNNPCTGQCIDCDVNCSSNTQCNDNNPDTNDTCENPASCDSYCKNEPLTCNGIVCQTGQICCNNTCTTPTCTTTSQCNDNDACTRDSCTTAGTCTAQCTHTAIPKCGWKKMVWTTPSCLPIAALFTVTVKEETGTLLEGVEITYGTQKMFTNAEGKVEMLGEKSQYTINATKEAYYPLTARKLASTTCKPTYTTTGTTPGTPAKGKIEIEVLETPYIGKEFTIKITDNNSQPLQGATITYSSQTAETNEQGEATLTGEKSKYTITATSDKGNTTTRILPRTFIQPDQNTSSNGGTTKPFTIPLDIIALAAIIVIGVIVLLRARATKKETTQT
ncbi:MAG: beta-galactosidase, partial [Candidatus Diapherotrites archaeon]|nr:beta-galactosidase [Candidatus Diapherotrites archaeon]